jgi:hypothetical protein
VKTTPKRKKRANNNTIGRYGSVPAKATYPRLATVEKLIEGDLSLLSFPIAKEWRRYWKGLLWTTEKHFAKQFLLCIIGGEITRDEFMLHFYLEYVDPAGGRNRRTRKIRRRILRVGMAPGDIEPISHIWDTYNVDTLPKRRVPDCLWPIIPSGHGGVKLD